MKNFQKSDVCDVAAMATMTMINMMMMTAAKDAIFRHRNLPVAAALAPEDFPEIWEICLTIPCSKISLNNSNKVVAPAPELVRVAKEVCCWCCLLIN